MSFAKISPNSLISAPLPSKIKPVSYWHHGNDLSFALAISQLFNTKKKRPVVVITEDMQTAWQLENEILFFANDIPIINFPDWETLPYDQFSPLPEIVSQRIEALYRLPDLQCGVLIIPINNLVQRVAPCSFLQAYTFILKVNETLDLEKISQKLEKGGYIHTSQVYSHGEFSIRGSILDLFPMGHRHPFRIDLFDDEIDSIRTFDPETQRSIDTVESINLLPAHEFPITDDSIAFFRQQYRDEFQEKTIKSIIYKDISNKTLPGGIEYYLPLFFEETATLFDYLPEDALLVHQSNTVELAQSYFQQVKGRFEELKHNPDRPLLNPNKLYLNHEILSKHLCEFQQIKYNEKKGTTLNQDYVPGLQSEHRAKQPFNKIQSFIAEFTGKILITAESTGRRETILDIFKKHKISPSPVDDWLSFLPSKKQLSITIANIDRSLILNNKLAIITESQVFGQVSTTRTTKPNKKQRQTENIVRDLTELSVGSPVVHEHHGVGRFIGLQKLSINDVETEFLTLQYAKDDKLYVPVSSLDLISRYTGVSPDHAPLHKLGSEQWDKARKKAAEKVRDVAAELLEIYAKREAQQGKKFIINEEEFAQFSSTFPFQETPDQLQAILATNDDLSQRKPMDRVVCGDVGFGKTEVAMRAAFVAVQNNLQVAVLVPTTLLAQQHHQNFLDRFSEWPFKIECLSRFRSAKQQKTIIEALANGQVDIVIGTHKLIQESIKYKRLGLVIIDEEHRFGVRQKEHFKAMRANIDLLTLTATPIPRTLNSAVSGIRDLSIIATPPAHRHPIKTFVMEWNDETIQEACLRESKRGGQIFLLHNEVKSIEKLEQEVNQLMPNLKTRVAHGQMREGELEQIMLDFYHRRFNILICTTIIESGIDIPNANTIIINRADKLGLAQLHQLRGRVGRSHHRAYAYLITPPQKLMTKDAVKRLEAIESLKDLGAGFTLATHDLEIRGAGELLGEEQSGQIHEIGFSLYTELLERAVKSIKSGEHPELLESPKTIEVDIHLPALIPDPYIMDVHSRLVFYKRIASASNEQELYNLQTELIDRFGLLPDELKSLFKLSELKLEIKDLGILKIDASDKEIRFTFDEKPAVDIGKVIQLIQSKPKVYQFDDKQRFKVIKETQPKVRIDEIKSLLEKIK
ncbi:MAG: transcription-repair coupling factor [Methylococcales bacterium]|nr:transcription-repair coupling factor [Methylococcales bacterium]